MHTYTHIYCNNVILIIYPKLNTCIHIYIYTYIYVYIYTYIHIHIFKYIHTIPIIHPKSIQMNFMSNKTHIKHDTNIRTCNDDVHSNRFQREVSKIYSLYV
jgi:hypothetical protein